MLVTACTERSVVLKAITHSILLRCGILGIAFGIMVILSCTEQPQPPTPPISDDLDQDGIYNKYDYCQEGESGWVSDGSSDIDSDGCQDSSEDNDDDNDGLLDTLDSCPIGYVNLGAGVAWVSDFLTDQDLNGCRDSDQDVDSDSDGIVDGADQCLTSINDWVSDESSDVDSDGCQDSSEDNDDDNDGLLDTLDSCPIGYVNLGAGMAWVSDFLTDQDLNGCRDSDQDVDSDSDGIVDGADQCLVSINDWMSNSVSDADRDGCQDSSEDDDDDNDGLLDTLDSCPIGYIDVGMGMAWVSNSAQDFDDDGCHDTVEDIDVCQLGVNSARCDTLRSYKNELLAVFLTTLSLSSGGVLPESPSANYTVGAWYTDRDELPQFSGKVVINTHDKVFYSVRYAPDGYTTTLTALLTATIDAHTVTASVSKQYTIPPAPVHKSAHTASADPAGHYLYFEDEFSLGELNYANWQLRLGSPWWYDIEASDCEDILRFVDGSLRFVLNFSDSSKTYICEPSLKSYLPLFSDGFYEFKHKTNGNQPGIRRSFWVYNAAKNGDHAHPEIDFLEYILNVHGPQTHCGIHYSNNNGSQVHQTIPFDSKSYDFGTNIWIISRGTNEIGRHYVTHTKADVTKSLCNFGGNITQYFTGYTFYLRLGMDETTWGSTFDSETFPDDGATWDIDYVRFYRQLPNN